jgi:hypothetical protein
VIGVAFRQSELLQPVPHIEKTCAVVVDAILPVTAAVAMN